MTVDEFHSYETLTVSGELRPTGCSSRKTWVATRSVRAPTWRRRSRATGSRRRCRATAPGSLEPLIADALGRSWAWSSVRSRRRAMCTSLADAYCGATVAEFPRLECSHPVVGRAHVGRTVRPGDGREPARLVPGRLSRDRRGRRGAVYYADLAAEPSSQARRGARSATRRICCGASRICLYGSRVPEQRAAERYEAALYDAMAGSRCRSTIWAILSAAEERVARVEDLLALPDTDPARYAPTRRSRPTSSASSEVAVLTTRRASSVTGIASEPSRRCAAPRTATRRKIRRDLARGGESAPSLDRWAGVSRGAGALHARARGPRLHLAEAGCARVDLDQDGRVDERDAARFEDAASAAAGRACGARNGWCDGADLDRTGQVDELDRAFLAAAKGCWYGPR